MDIRMAVDYLGLNANYCKLTQAPPPHSIVEWSGPDPQPTQSELEAAYAAAVLAQAWVDLRTKRNELLADTDFFANTDVTMPDAMRTYRQALRDLPANTSDPANPTWPTKPSS